MKRRRRIWLAAEIDRLFALRDVQKLTWCEIGEVFGDSGVNCCTRYKYYSDKRRIEALRRGEVAPAQRRSSVARRSTPEPTPKAAPVIAKAVPGVKRPRYFHAADADIIARIDRQGLTAGFLGDPPTGRSALDQKQNGA